MNKINRRKDNARSLEDDWVALEPSSIKNEPNCQIKESAERKPLSQDDVKDFLEFGIFTQHRILPFVNKNGAYGIYVSNLKRLPHKLIEKYKNEIIDVDPNQIDVFMSEHWNTKSRKIKAYQNEMQIPAIHIVKEILQKMIDANASDVTISSRSDNVVVSYAVSGKNDPTIEDYFDKDVAEKIRISIINMAGENQGEKIVDGSFATILSEKLREFRLNYMETAAGFALVLRSYQSFDLDKTLPSLGYMPRPLEIIRNIIDQNPYGIFLITGPTGSGKTTTIYTLINQERVARNLKIKTAEDPVEVMISGIDQCAINKKGDDRHLITYQKLLAAFMRQRPDIIVIGEIRDKEVAISTIEAALTGHVVISTLHTNNVESTFTRLLTTLGISDDRIEDSFSGVLSQRLVEKLCQNCKVDDGSGGSKAGPGCDHCKATPGFDGLVIACEVASMNKGIQNYKKENFKEYYSYKDSANDLYQSGLIEIKTKKLLETL